MLLRYRSVGALNAALQVGPKPLDCVGMVDATLPLVNVMVDPAMVVAKSPERSVAPMHVGGDSGFLRHILLNDRKQGSRKFIRDDFPAQAAVTLDNSEDG